MTTAMSSILIGIFVIGFAILFAVLREGSDILPIVLTVIAMFVTIWVVDHVITTAASRAEADYKSIMANRPECLDTNPSSLKCVEEYKDWMKDSIDAQATIDSLRATLEEQINKARSK